MKTRTAKKTRSRLAFTLVELLIVIAIIAVLAAMLFPAFSAVKKSATLRKVKGEIRRVEAAIDSYHGKYGHYPPDNRLGTGQEVQPLFYELVGTRKILANGVDVFETLDRSEQIPTADVKAGFLNGNVEGFVNCTKGSDDEAASAKNFLPGLKPGLYGFTINGGKRVVVLTSSVAWPGAELSPAPYHPVPNSPGMNPIRYNSSSPTHNPKSYDLWVDIILSGKTNRISNWSDSPEIVSTPVL
jgi:prepilin-type N-terminal cleavage/methylation domain-containing protein